MNTIAQRVPGLIIPIKAQVVYGIVLAIIFAILSGIYYLVLESRTEWQGTCEADGWTESSLVEMVVDCGSQGAAEIEADNVISAYLRNPGPLTCERTAADNIYCEERPALEAKED